MSHPNIEELTAFIYGELAPPRAAELAEHLGTCAECRERTASWREVRRELAAWDLALADRSSRTLAPAGWARGMLRWAVAAAVLVGTGFGLARLTAPARTPDLAALRAEVVRAVGDQLRQDLEVKWAGYADEQASRQQEFRQAIAQAVSRIEARQIVEHASLRQDVETVALRTQQEFDRIIAFNPQGGLGPSSEGQQ